MSGLLAASMLEQKPALPWLVSALTSLKPEEKDSSGIAMIEPKGIRITRTMNVIQALSGASGATGSAGIGVTEPFTKFTIQPMKCFDRLIMSFDGSLENSKDLMDLVRRKGYDLGSDDLDHPTAIIACMLDWYMTTEFMELSLIEALSLTMEDLQGSFTLAVIDHQDKNSIAISRKNADVYLAATNDGVFASTDKSALPEHGTIEVLEDTTIAILRLGECVLLDYSKAFVATEV